MIAGTSRYLAGTSRLYELPRTSSAGRRLELRSQRLKLADPLSELLVRWPLADAGQRPADGIGEPPRRMRRMLGA